MHRKQNSKVLLQVLGHNSVEMSGIPKQRQEKVPADGQKSTLETDIK